jgi:single-strand DNA-binding protein
MASFSKTIIGGNLGRDVELKYMANGKEVASFTVAVTDPYKKDETTWYRVSAFGKTAEFASKYLSKGSTVIVEGRMKSRQWEDKSGNKRESWDLIADSVQSFGGKRSEPVQDQAHPHSEPEVDVEDIPF